VSWIPWKAKERERRYNGNNDSGSKIQGNGPLYLLLVVDFLGLKNRS
jgi:hypothetical protein